MKTTNPTNLTVATPLATALTTILFALVLCLGATQARAQANVTVDSTTMTHGFINVSALPADGGGFVFNSGWALPDLFAGFSGAVLTFTPNTSIDRDAPNDPFWWQPDGSPNKYMDSSVFAQDDTLAGQTVIFSGYCWTNTLALPYSTNATAFIKDFAADFSSSTVVTSNLTGGFFSITLATTAGHHIQYGFEMIGPDARLTNATISGKVVLSSNAPPLLPTITTAPVKTSVLLGSNATFTVSASGDSLTYQWQKNNVNLVNGAAVAGATTDTLSLSNVQGNGEANYSVIVSNQLGVATATARLVVLDPSHLTMDPTANWVGFMNVFDVNTNYVFGSVWGTADLRGRFNAATLSLAPNTNTYNPVDAFWVNPDGSGNKLCDASFYQENDSLVGMTVTFVGYCPSNTLASPYTSTVFIKDFAPDFSSSASTTVPLVSGQAFSLTLATINSPGRHIQWGFETFGLDANPATAPSLGQALVSVNPPALNASMSGGVVSLTFPTERGLGYTVQYKTNLTDATWQSLSTVNGTGSSGLLTDPAGQARRFYRLSLN